MKNVILIPNNTKDDGFLLTEKILSKLVGLGFNVYLDVKYRAENLSSALIYDTPPSFAELIVVIGGDGTVIEASRLATELDIPLLGVNLGKVGYLASVDPERLELLDSLVNGEYITESRMLLSATKHSVSGDTIISDRLAVNDIVVSHDNYFGISDFRVENEHGDHVHFRADGIIASTPQGSTAYSLSAGGPVVSHSLDSIMLTPICPHSFFNRAIIYSPDECIKISNAGDSRLNISIDGRFFDILEKGEFCTIYKSEKRLKMLSFSETNVFSILSKKIKLLHDYS